MIVLTEAERQRFAAWLDEFAAVSKRLSGPSKIEGMDKVDEAFRIDGVAAEIMANRLRELPGGLFVHPEETKDLAELTLEHPTISFERGESGVTIVPGDCLPFTFNMEGSEASGYTLTIIVRRDTDPTYLILRTAEQFPVEGRSWIGHLTSADTGRLDPGHYYLIGRLNHADGPIRETVIDFEVVESVEDYDRGNNWAEDPDTGAKG